MITYERADEACLALIYYLGREHDSAKKTLLAADLLARAQDIARPTRDLVNAFVQASLNNDENAEMAERTIEQVKNASPTRKHVDIAFFGVTDDEWPALRDVLNLNEKDFRPYKRRRRYWEVEFESTMIRRPLKVVVSVLGRAHNIHVQRVLNDFHELYDADTYCLAGTCGGRAAKVRQGDVVVPEMVYWYEPGKLTREGMRPRFEREDLPEEIRNNLFFLNLDESGFYSELAALVDRIPVRERPDGVSLRGWKPKLVRRNTALASGEKVITNDLLDELADGYDDRTCAADQEAYGFALALKGQTWCIFRGVNDFASVTKDDTWQYLSTATAVLAAKKFFETQYPPPDGDDTL